MPPEAAEATRSPAGARGEDRCREARRARRRIPRGVRPAAALEGQALQVFARLEADRAPGRDPYLLARARVAPDAALPGLHLEDPEAAQLDPLTLHQGVLHRFE